MKKITFVLLCVSSNFTYSQALTILPGEVIARDLNTPGLGSVGHVGITMGPTIGKPAAMVVEVLNDKKRVVQANTIQQFKNITPYWGSRYGVLDNTQRSLNVLREANSQRCLRSDYTMTSIAFPAKGDLRGYPTDSCVTTKRGQFRCDTFLNYLYNFGGFNLLSGKIITPATIFQAFPKGNHDGPRSMDNFLYIPEGSNQKQYEIETVTPEQLDSISLNEFVSTIDKQGNDKMKNISEKLWGFYIDRALKGHEKKYFLLDYLRGVAKPKLLPDLIKKYNETDDPELKTMLLKVTQSIHNRYDNFQTDLNRKILLENFYEILIKNNDVSSEDKLIATESIIMMGSKDFILANIDKLTDVFNNQDSYEQIGFKCNLMIQIPELQNKYTDEVLSLLEKKKDKQLEERFFYYVKEALSKNLNDVSLVNKVKIRQYLESINDKYDEYMKSDISDGLSTMFAPGAFLESLSLVSSNSYDEAGHFIAEYVKDKSKLLQVSYIIGFSKHPFIKNAYKNESFFVDFVNKNKNISKKSGIEKYEKSKLDDSIILAIDIIKGD